MLTTKIKIYGAVLVLIAAGVFLAFGDGFQLSDDVDTSERRKYTLIANTHMNRAMITVRISSSVRGRVAGIENRRVRTPWSQSWWAERGEVLTISFSVRTYGDQRYRSAPWARCEILRNGVMAGGDVEIDQRRLVERPDDVKAQARAHCAVTG